MKSYCQKHNYPSWRAVVLAGGVDEAHGVQQGGEQGLQLCKLCFFNFLGIRYHNKGKQQKLLLNNYLKPIFQRLQMKSDI